MILIEKELEEAQWHYSSGRQYGDAFYILIAEFDVINKIWNEQIESPSYYCAGLATEHFLKGYLSMEKIIFPNKSHKGHDLANLISISKEKIKNFFELEESDIEEINLLNQRYYNYESYGKDDLRYASKSGVRLSPHPDSLNRIIKKMEKNLMLEIQKEY